MINTKNKIIIFLALACCVSVISLAVLLKSYGHYQRINPPRSKPEKGECTTSGLVSHWPLDTLQEYSTPDMTRNNPGKISYFFIHNPFFAKFFFGVPKQVKGRSGNALEFNGKHWISGGNDKCFNVDKFTVALWVWLDNYNNIPTIMAKGSFTGYDGWWLCTLHNTGFFDLGIGWGNDFGHVKSGYKLPLHEWHFLGVTVDNTRQEVQFYVDGQPYGEKHTNVHKWHINWHHDLFIGEFDGGGYWSWQGRLDEVRFYSTILDAKEILQVYLSTSEQEKTTQH